MKKKQVLLFNDEFSIDLSSNKNWNHVVGVTSTDFQYYTKNKENRWESMRENFILDVLQLYTWWVHSYVKNGALHIKPTLRVDRHGDDFLKKGYLDLTEEGCDPKAVGKRCIM